MAYYHGHRSDYDRWAANRLPQWSYAHVLPYFRRQESWEGGADAYRGGDGPLTTQYSRFEDPLCEAFIAAGKAAGHPVTDDYNGAQAGRLRADPDDAAQRPALQRRDRVSAARDGAPQLDGRGRRARHPDRDGRARARSASSMSRAARPRWCAPIAR